MALATLKKMLTPKLIKTEIAFIASNDVHAKKCYHKKVLFMFILCGFRCINFLYCLLIQDPWTLKYDYLMGILYAERTFNINIMFCCFMIDMVGLLMEVTIIQSFFSSTYGHKTTMTDPRSNFWPIAYELFNVNHSDFLHSNRRELKHFTKKMKLKVILKEPKETFKFFLQFVKLLAIDNAILTKKRRAAVKFRREFHYISYVPSRLRVYSFMFCMLVEHVFILIRLLLGESSE